jgi:flagellar biosynthesis/type III secretory pathway protein FliH
MATIIRHSDAPANEASAFAFDDLERRTARATAAAEEACAARTETQLDSLVSAMRSAVDALDEAKAQWLAHWEQSALIVATAIASRVIRREVERTPDITLALVKEALELAAGSADVQLRMHPDDVAAFGKRVKQVAAELGRLGDVKIAADPQITKGGCRVDTRFGTIDQQFEAQLARIELELA